MELVHPDGTRLGATLVPGAVPAGRTQSRATVVVAGATGVPHRYYDAIARWIGESHGVDVLTFDYRGIGASRTGSLKGFDAGYRDWASDLKLAIDWAADRGPTVVLGHSFGGHAFGMTDAHERTLGLYTFATGAGWHGWMRPAESLRVRTLWNLVAPPLVAWHGYLAWSHLGMGEDLPYGVYADWKKWCRTPNYFFDDPEAEFAERFASVSVPVVGVNSTDDAWATPDSAQAFLSHYPGARCITVTPSSIGQRTIGHMAYVRPRCQTLWASFGAFLEERLSTVNADQTGDPTPMRDIASSQ